MGNGMQGARYVQLHPAHCLCVQDVCRQFQPSTWTQTNRMSGLILTLTRTPTTWTARPQLGQSWGSVVFWR